MAATDSLLVNRHHIPYELDGGIASRAAIGLVVLATDRTIERKWRSLLGGIDGVAYYQGRIWNSPVITPEELARMEELIPAAVDLIEPNDFPLDVVAFGCTSGAMVIGDDRVADRVHEVRPGVAVTNPIGAGLAAMRALGARRIALLTPYIDEINAWMRDYIEERGISVPVMGSFNNGADSEVARISETSIEDALVDLGQHPSVDAVFVSCTSLRVASIVTRAEDRIGKPVTSSNHAMAWHALRLAGVDDALPGRGQLFEVALA